MNSNVRIAFGIALISAVIGGLSLSSKTYYFTYPGRGKSEVPKEFYESRKENREKYFSVVREVNYDAAFVAGLLSLGLSFLVIGRRIPKVSTPNISVKVSRPKIPSWIQSSWKKNLLIYLHVLIMIGIAAMFFLMNLWS